VAPTTDNIVTSQELSSIIYRHDPEGLARLGCPSDEYDSEAAIILSLLSECDGTYDVQELLYTTFASRFGGDLYKGKFSRFLALACEIFWKRY
jgi:hypothetical protein